MSDGLRRYDGISRTPHQILPEQWRQNESQTVNLSLLVGAIPGAES